MCLLKNVAPFAHDDLESFFDSLSLSLRWPPLWTTIAQSSGIISKGTISAPRNRCVGVTFVMRVKKSYKISTCSLSFFAVGFGSTFGFSLLEDSPMTSRYSAVKLTLLSISARLLQRVCTEKLLELVKSRPGCQIFG